MQSNLLATPPIDSTETAPMSPEAAQQLLLRLSKVPETSGLLRKTLGSQNVAEFFQIVGAVEVVEMDWHALSGQMTQNQLGQYCALSGEFELTMERLAQLAHKIANQFIPRLPELVQRDLAGHSKKEGLANLFLSIDKLCVTVPPELEGKICYRQFLNKMFKRMVFGLLGAQLIQIELTSGNRQLSHAIHIFLDRAEEISLAREGMQFDGIQLHNELVFYRKALLKPDNRQALDRLIGMEGQSLTEAQKKALITETQANLSEIRREASYKRILLHTLHDREPQIVVHGDDNFKEGEGSRYAQFCTFRINFDPRREIGLPQVQSDKFGNTLFDYSNMEGVVNFTLNPVTGELQIITNPMVTLSAILDADRYLLLKHHLLIRLKEYLQAKEPDIEDLFLPSATETLRSEQADVHEQVEENLDTDSPDLSDQAFTEPTWKYEPYAPSVPAQQSADQPRHVAIAGEGQSTAGDEFKALPKHLRKVIIDKIWGASGPEVMAVLRRLFGESVRQSGSHVFFRSERTGETLPVPNGTYIAPPLLMENLRLWGYSLMEFTRELGLKI